MELQIELCSNLERGGTTPSAGYVKIITENYGKLPEWHVRIKYQVLEKLDPDAALRLKAENIKLPSFRRDVIEEAFDKKEYIY